ncbi:MAG: right-handed parallel beta-helix repeat-containing protein, partial [Anaerolineae bacterium]|nr:right-handed parallel beta-helix repeat-containing protein [Anaerolineae bacterium]
MTYIKSGVTVTVPDNAYLFIDNNQKIIVESGGSLVIQSGARVVCYSSAKIEVNSGGTLTVNGSAVLQFGSGSEILCNGKLIADSNDPAKRITFTGTTSTPGSWYGIKINSGSSTNVSTLRRCDVQYAIDGVTITYTGNSNNVTIDKCRIRNNLSYGIYVYGTFSATAHPTISNNHIHNNGDGINLFNYAKPAITYNRIESNLSTGIYGNTGCSATVEFNYVRDGGYGIAFEFNSLAQVHRNTVTACVQGAGIYASSSSNLVAYGSGDNKGRNKITANNADGIESLDCSPVFGKNITNQYGNNQIQDNTLYQAQHSGSGQLQAEQCYWAGQQNDIFGNVDNSPYLASVPSPVGWGQSDNYDPSFLIPSKDDFIPTGPITVAHMANAAMAKNGAIINEFDPVAWSAKFGAAMEAGLGKGDWVDAAQVITELWRELQDSRVPAVDYALLVGYAENITVESSIRKYLALALIEKSLAEQDVSTALTDLAKYGQSNKAHAAEFLANAGVIHLHRQNDLTTAQNILAQLQVMAQNGDALAARQVNVFNKILQNYRHHISAKNLGTKEPIDNSSQVFTPPGTSSLAQNYPNPFNPATTIRFRLNERQRVRLVIFDITGQRVRTLVEGELPAGEQAISWDGSDQQGRLVASGVYFYELA